MAGGVFGFGLVLIFLAITNYLIDAYTIFAASVLAANSLLRSAFGAAFPMFTSAMYRNLGIHWASSVPAFLALACLPAPFLLYRYGASIRARCTYAAQAERAMAELRQKAAGPSSDDTLPSSLKETDDVEKQAIAAADVHDSVSRSQSTSSASTDLPEAKEDRQFAPIRPGTAEQRNHRRSGSFSLSLTRTRSIAEAAEYEGNPYDIDRVHTNRSVRGI